MSRVFIDSTRVCELIPGMTKNHLAQLRYRGNSGLKFYKQTPKTVLYIEDEVIEWVEKSARYISGPNS